MSFLRTLWLKTPNLLRGRKLKYKCMLMESFIHLIKHLQKLTIKAHDSATNKELVVTLVEASLVINGQNTTALKIPGTG